MQSFRLDRTSNVILEIEGGMAANRQVQFLDPSGRCLLVLLSRSRKVLGQTRHELVVNSVDGEGRWMSEIAAELPAAVLQGDMELRFCDWKVELSTPGGQRLLSFNPSVSFGRHVSPALASEMRTNLSVARLKLRTGRLPQIPEMTDIPGNAVTFVLLHAPWADEGWREGMANAGLWFCQTLFVEIAPESPAENEARLASALRRATGDFVALLSGGWRIRDLQHLMRQFARRSRPDAVMLASDSATLQPGDFWGVVVPRSFLGQPALRLQRGLIGLHPGLLATGYWLLPQVWEDTGGVLALHAACAIQPIPRDGNGRLQEPLLRPAEQVYALAPGGEADPDAGAGQPFGGLHIDRAPLSTAPTARLLLSLLREAADLDCSGSFMVWAPEAITAARARTWPAPALFSDVEVVTDAGGQAVGLLISRAVLTAPRIPSALSALPPAAREKLDQPQLSVAEAIGAAIEALSALDLVIGRRSLEDLDALVAAEPAAPRDPLWLADRTTLPKLLAMELPADREGEDLKDLVEGPDGFDARVLQGLHFGLVQEICAHAIAADLRLPEEGYVARLVGLALGSGHADDDELRLQILEALVARNYHAEARALLRPVPETALPLLAMKLHTLDIVVRDRDPLDRTWLDRPLSDLLPPAWPEVPDVEKTAAAALVTALIAYAGKREAWARVLDLAAGVPEFVPLRHDAEELILMARVITGAHEGLAARIALLARQKRISDWSHHRLALMLADAQGNPDAVAAAVQRLLQGEADMAALLNPPTKFRLLGPAAGTAGRKAAKGVVAPVGPDEVACIIVARNEFARLKWLHGYYRRLGVSRFFLIDNMSDDRTLPYFAAQPDVTVLQTDENYRDTRYGVKWHNEVADAWLENRWVLTVDADEALVFDGCEAPGSLRDLVGRLEAEGAEGFFAPMFDMYAEGAMTGTPLEPGDSLIELFPMLDGSGYHFAPKIGYPRRAMTGGVRIRLFWSNWHVPNTPNIVMQKVPLVRWKRGFRYLASTHDMTPLKVAQETGALLHFKFLPDFHARALEEVRRNQHYEGAREYRVYADFLSRSGGGSFVGPTSVRYEGFETLVRMGVVTPAAPRPQPAGGKGGRRPAAAAEPAAPVPPQALATGTARELSVMDGLTGILSARAGDAPLPAAPGAAAD